MLLPPHDYFEIHSYHWVYQFIPFLSPILNMWMYCHLFIRSPIDVHLGCFYFEAIINKAAMNIQGHIFRWAYVFFPFG